MSILKDIAYEASHYGVKLDELCAAIGFSIDDLEDVDRWVDLEAASNVWEQAVRISDNQYLGLHIGQSSNPYVVGVVGYLMESSPDLGTAIEHLTGFNAVFADMFQYRYELKEDRFIMYYEPSDIWWLNYPHTARQAIETSMARTIAIIQDFTGKKILPLKATVKYALVGDESIYEKHLKTRVSFNESDNALYFDKTIWNLPVKSYNKTLHQYFKGLAEEQLTHLKKEESLNYQVKRYLLSNVNQQLPSIEQTAEHLELNVRTMQRRLKQEGLTFQQLTDTVRKDLAIDVLRKQKGKIEEVAHFLGYSEASVFRRAFKRWTGLTPSVFLQQNH